MLDELEDVLLRERFAVRLEAAGVGAHDLVLGYGALAKLVKPALIEPVIDADPDDDAVIACALSSQSEIIVSGDSHMLELKRYESIRIVTATEFITDIL